MFAWFTRLFRPAAPRLLTVDEHFDQMVDAWTREEPPSRDTVREVAAHLADLRSGTYRSGVHLRPVEGLQRVRLHDGHREHGWIRATPSQADQARAAGLAIRPESDFPLPDIEPAA